MIVTPQEKPLAALQCRISVTRGVTLKTQDIEAGDAAREADKSLTCTVSNLGPRHGSGVVCVLAGGSQRIPNGAVVQAHFEVDKGARAVTVWLDKVLGATSDGKPVPIPDLQRVIR